MLAALLVAVLIFILAFLKWYVTAMPGRSFTGELPPLDRNEHELRDRLKRHVEILAGDIGERNVSNPGKLDEAARYIEQTLNALGYSVDSQEYQVSGATVRNLGAELPGLTQPDEIVLVGGHYDSVVGCPGANDNATGVAAVLELARYFAGREVDRTVRLVAFVNEEPPFCFTWMMGSRVYAKRSRTRGENVVAMLSLETIGFYSDAAGSQRYPFPFGFFYPKTGNFIAFVGNLSSRSLVRRSVTSFRRHARFPSEGTAAPGYLPGIFWSDHWSFWREGYRALMVTDTAPFRYPYYHTADDTPDKVDFEMTARVVSGLANVVEDLTRGRNPAWRS